MVSLILISMELIELKGNMHKMYLWIGGLLVVGFLAYCWSKDEIGTPVMLILAIAIFIGWPIIILIGIVYFLTSWLDALRGTND